MTVPGWVRGKNQCSGMPKAAQHRYPNDWVLTEINWLVLAFVVSHDCVPPGGIAGSPASSSVRARGSQSGFSRSSDELVRSC